MPAEKIPHLCGGILFGLLLEARRTRRKARNKFNGGTDHLTTVDIYAGLIKVVTGDDVSPAGRTISKACTLYKTCQNGSGVYVPFTERATIAAFDSAVKTKNPDIPKRMSEFIDMYLNLDRCEWLVRAIIETIHLDEDIQENEEFLIDYDNIVCADDLPFVSNVVLEPFLISVLHYVLKNCPDAESGRPTFENWYSQSSKNAEWKLQVDVGGSISPLRVYSRLPVSEADYPDEEAPEEKMGSAFITDRSKTAPDLALYKDGIFYLEEGLVDVSEDCDDTDDEDIRLYLNKIGQKYGSVRTLLNPYQQTPVRSIYVCNDIIRSIPVPGRFRNTYTVEYIHEANAQGLAACSNFVIIIGTGGIGKSMMIRHLLLDAIEHYSEDGIVPIFLMLKDYDVSSSSLLDYLVSKIRNFSPGITAEQLTSLLDAGRCLLLLDGLDEVGTKQADAFEKKLEEFIDRFPDNQYVVSSRPHRTFSAYSRFTILKIRPFTIDQALALVDKLECSADDSAIKEEFRAKLPGLYGTHRQFVENPLLLTIMYMTYELFRDVPSKMHLFYRDAYDALSKSHDALKGLKRPSETGLTADEFAEWFSEFCARTYYDEKYEFTEYEFAEYFNALTQHSKHPDRLVSAKAFRDDLCDNLCLMYFESGKYHFTHRSFQEYFCALFFSKQKDRTLEGIGDFFDNLRSRNYGDKTFSMLYDMIPGKIDEYVFIPYLKKLFEECDAGDGYWSFLETMYPRIEFTNGDTEYEAEVSPASFIYEFIRTTFFNENYDFDSLPREEAFIRERYAYVYDEPDGNQSLVELGEISFEYQQEYGMPDEVGWLYEVDIGKLREKRFLHKEMLAALNDDSFSLKKEYCAAKECLNILLDKQKPKGHNFFDRFS